MKLKYVKEDLGISGGKEFGAWLLNEKGFAALPGGDFGEAGEGYLRLSYAEDRNNHIIPGVKHLMKIIIELVEKSGETAPISAEEVEEKVSEIEGKHFG